MLPASSLPALSDVERAPPVGIRLDAVRLPSGTPERGDILAVRNVDLEVRPGELMTLLGPSGCGKTTTLRMIAGFQEPAREASSSATRT